MFLTASVFGTWTLATANGRVSERRIKTISPRRRGMSAPIAFTGSIA